jgi:hypothetical protein
LHRKAWFPVLCEAKHGVLCIDCACRAGDKPAE